MPTKDSVAYLFTKGEVFAYPTEAVYGLGCDPQNRFAVERILHMKDRPVEKGMILIASSFEQLSPYVELISLAEQRVTEIMQSWPGPVTWLLPKSEFTPDWISGESELVAVRVTDHPVVKRMCDDIGSPIVSTSANPAGEEPARSAEQVKAYFGDALHVVCGKLGGLETPSKILNSLTLEMVRT